MGSPVFSMLTSVRSIIVDRIFPRVFVIISPHRGCLPLKSPSNKNGRGISWSRVVKGRYSLPHFHFGDFFFFFFFFTEKGQKFMFQVEFGPEK